MIFIFLTKENFFALILGKNFWINFLRRENTLRFKKLTKREKEEALFLGYDEIVQRRVRVHIPNYKENKPKEKIIKLPNVFNHFISDSAFKENHNNINDTAFSSKQVVVKNLSNLDKIGFANALDYDVRNSEQDLVLNEQSEYVEAKEVLEDWKKDFGYKKNSKEVWHLSFCIDEGFSQRSIKALEESVREVMQKNFSEYKFVLVTHTHQNKPHIHALINKNNIYTGKKLHFSNQDFKEFFNTLRGDFAFCLNQRGFQYHNKFKLENNLTKIKERLEKDNFLSRKNLNAQLANLQSNLHKKMELKVKKVEKFSLKNEELKEKRKAFLEEIKELKAIDTNHKKLFAIFKDLKEIGQEISSNLKEMKTLKKEFFALHKNFKNIDSERKKYQNEFENLEKKKAYLNFLLNNFDKKSLSKNEILTLEQIRKDLILCDEKTSQELKENIKASLIVSSLLNKNNTGFDLISSCRELEKNLNALKKSNAEKESLADYEKRLETNRAILLELINQRFFSLQKDLQRDFKEKEIKKYFYKFKEYEKIALFLNKHNNKEIENLALKFKEMQKTKEVPQKIIEIKKEQKTKEQNSEKSKKELPPPPKNIENSLDLSENEKKAFIAFLIEKRKISNKKFYENFFLEQLNKNELKDFKELYGEFLTQRKSEEILKI